ncbi:hypothetical protein B0I35DRAFT_377904 [Stachybotrys elegans]|uniref:XPG-I domain-containing protein n=1 Tax=Stachybotrys elegans TaxID=80388 RepID=A0A8K0SR68_9HYPO|nr:hypothetical protein B0I35DRAFT_377904 [Stachybotrys elegans]
MGIKGIYRELGPGQRVALSKLAAESLESTGRPFRIAIDIAIWQFQTQAARGGTNPAIRTLFYRLVRLMSTPIQPIFVFDGPQKPTFKRNKRSGRGDGVAIALAKRLIHLFGFPVHNAPGEAEAECAFLQKHGVVDAVLSEDVDTIMFGCTKTLRNWSSESKGQTVPTHVSVYDTQKDKGIIDSGLGREGMVLVALMSGGDYLPEGIPGCGPKVACEAARAGFGSICRLKASSDIQNWKDSLVHELKTNEQKFFRTKHKALEIPDTFPNIEVLRSYTRPAVSPESVLDSLRQSMDRKRAIDLDGLREFTREIFDWNYRIGAIKFIRVLAHALLVQKLLHGPSATEAASPLVERIASRREHFSTDASSELKVFYIPQDIVPIDLSKEVDEEIPFDRNGLALDSDDDAEAPVAEASTAKIFDVSKPDSGWVLDGIIRKALPDMLHAWEEAEQTKKAKKLQPKTKTAARRKTKAKDPVAPHQSLDKFFHVTKSSAPDPIAPTKRPLPRPASPPPNISKESRATSTPEKRNPGHISSHAMPRTKGISEPILISSSPISSPPQSSHSKQGDGRDLQGLRNTRNTHPLLVLDSSPPRARKPQPKTKMKDPATKTGLKQTSLDSFVITSPSRKPQSKSLLSPMTIDCPDPEPEDDFPTSKMLLVPSGAGYYREIKVRGDQVDTVIARETRLLENKGIRAGVARWSDVSIIDLTGDE